jgi:hypothetical protein
MHLTAVLTVQLVRLESKRQSCNSCDRQSLQLLYVLVDCNHQQLLLSGGGLESRSTRRQSFFAATSPTAFSSTCYAHSIYNRSQGLCCMPFL